MGFQLDLELDLAIQRGRAPMSVGRHGLSWVMVKLRYRLQLPPLEKLRKLGGNEVEVCPTQLIISVRSL